MKSSNPKVTILNPKSVSPKGPSLKKWVVKANATFAVITIIMYILLSLIADNRAGDSNVFVQTLVFIFLGGGMIVAYALTFLSAIVAIALNVIYFSQRIHWSISRPAFRIVLALVNIVVFVVFLAVLSMLFLT